MSREQTESVVKTVETLLAEAEQLKNHCRRQNEDIKLIMEELQRENKELAQNYEQAEHEMEEMRKALSELMDTKIAFEARERQVRKLSKTALRQQDIFTPMGSTISVPLRDMDSSPPITLVFSAW